MSERDRDEIPRGLKLLHTLRGHEDFIRKIAWSPDGMRIASASDDKTIRIWNVETGKIIASFIKVHANKAGGVAWSPDGQTIALGSGKTVYLWDSQTGQRKTTLEGHEDVVEDVKWSPNDKKLISVSYDKRICIWTIEKQKNYQTLQRHRSLVYEVAWSPDGKLLASASMDQSIIIWNLAEPILTLVGHNSQVLSVQWSPDGRWLASGSVDSTVRIWDVQTGKELRVLEGHASGVNQVAFSADSQLLASNSLDGTVRLWRCDSWESVAIFPTVSQIPFPSSLAFHPNKPLLASPGRKDSELRLWELDLTELLGNDRPRESVNYTTAKIVLVGDSGVGKTGLGWRLAHNAYKEHDSTHGQQFWVIDELGTQRADGTQCEAVLWDLAGQPDYRLVHSLFLEDVDLALILFDPTKREETLSGVDYWLKQLQQQEDSLCPVILVGARSDRGTSTLTPDELAAYSQQKGISGGYLATSAKSGEGLPALLSQIKESIPWDKMAATVTTTTFKRIKEYVLSLKAEAERESILVSPTTLRQQLETRDPDWQFSDAEMRAAVRHLENHGYVTILRGSQGNISILLVPDLLANLASSIVLEARRNPKGLGVLEEAKLLRGEYPFPELALLTEEEREILLDAAAVLFLEHNLCFRETFSDRTFFAFPSLINEKRPQMQEIKTFEDVSYRVSGAVENVYAALVVLLGYTNTFTRTNQWQNQAQYQLGEGEICGFRQIAEQEGAIELILYYAENTPDYVCSLFQGLFERFLCGRHLAIDKYEPAICPQCSERQERNAVIKQLERGRDFKFCDNCGERFPLPAMQPLEPSRQQAEKLDEEQAVAQRRTAFEAALVRVKGLLRDRAGGEGEQSPTCFISYAWGVSEHERWVVRFARDLQNAGIDALLDRWHNPPGHRLSRYVDRLESSDFVVVVGTPQLREKYETREKDPVVAAELTLLNTRLRKPSKYGPTAIPLLLAGESDISFTPQLQDVVSIDFRLEDSYFVNLFNLIWRIYELPFDNPLLEELRASMSPRPRF